VSARVSGYNALRDCIGLQAGGVSVQDKNQQW
jgi:hypothetical protein